MGRRLGAELADEYGWDRPLSVIPHGTDAVRFRPARDKVERAVKLSADKYCSATIMLGAVAEITHEIEIVDPSA